MQNNYNHFEVEQKRQDLWAKSKVYEWNQDEPRDHNFVIDTPPPTVSGLLHMGHIFSYTQTDFIARFMRMIGKNVFYPIGFDDNGLATERLVEKLRDIKAGQMHRDEFKKICNEVVSDAEEEFRALFRSIALSVDWRQEYRTVSNDTTRISQMSFLDLVKKGYAERRLGPTFWDPVDRTAIAQAEIEDKEKAGIMNDIIFKCEDGSELKIATTRPELIPACIAMFYYPDDARYTGLSGKNAITPIYGKKIPILPDEDVDMEKGTGLVMCCTFGDIQDVTWWNRHKLQAIQSIDIDGKMTNAGHLDGLYVKEARAKIIEQLKQQELLTAQTEIKQMVKCAERSGAPLEIIPTYQWYIKILDKKEELLAKGRQCAWHPDYMRVRFENWVIGLNQDWCISRQRYFGVPFPVWYSKRPGEEGKVLFADTADLPLDPTLVAPRGYSIDEVTAETDVMDTWATSSLTPQINAHGISPDFAVDEDRFKKLYPADLRPQAHEIIRTWAFYTITKSLLHNNSIPWKSLMISGWCLAADKTKMSKSKGNVVTPKALIIEKGADIVRYWASHSKLGVDIAYSEELFKIGNKLINKIWNASKFISIHFGEIEGAPSTAAADVKSGIVNADLDLWILSALGKVLDSATKSFHEYEYCDARVTIENFFWNDLCDNYLELIKVRVYDTSLENKALRQSAIYTLHHVFKTLYKLFAPFIPHVVDELNSNLFGEENVHARGSWPKLEDCYMDEKQLATGEAVKVALEAVRKHKSLNQLSLRAELETFEYDVSNIRESALQDLMNAANVKKFV